MKIAKHIVTLMTFASVSALAAPDSTATQPVAEAPAAPVAPVAAPEIAPAPAETAAVADSTVQTAEAPADSNTVAEVPADTNAVAEVATDSNAVAAAAPEAVPDTTAGVTDTATVPQVADTVKTAQEPAKPNMDSLFAAVAVPIATMDTAEAAKPAPEKKAPASPLDNILHGNAYNPVANEAAAATVGSEMSMPHKMFNRRFAYFEPVDQEGVVSFGQNMTYFFAFDNNNDLALVSAGLAKENFGFMLQGAVGKKWSYVDDDNDGTEQTVKGTRAGTAIGGTVSAKLAGLDYAIRVTYDHPESELSVTGGDTEVESDIWNLGGKFMVSKSGPVSWSAGLSIYRYNAKNKVTQKTVFEQNGKYYLATSTANTTDSTARVEVVPEFNVGGAILSREKARVFLGLNMMAPLTSFDRVKNVCSRHNEYALEASPNILGEVMLGSHVVAFGSASHQWEVFRYRDSYINDVSTKTVDVSSGITTANVGMRLEYEMVALEVAFTQQFMSNPFGAFSSTDEVMTSIGMFINF